jgi:transposase
MAGMLFKKRDTSDELRELISSVRDGTFHYEGRPKKSLDWSSYDEAQVREVSNMLRLMRTFVDEASNRIPSEEGTRRRGRPPVYSPSDVAKALLLQSYFGVSNRVAAGLVDLFEEKLGISKAFSYKTIERGYDPGPVTQILQEVFRLTNELGNSMEGTFSVDGSGDPTSMKANYESVRSEQKRKKGEGDDDGNGGDDGSDGDSVSSPSTTTRHDFQYTSSSVGVHTKIVAGFRGTDDHAVGELSMFPSVIAQTRINCPGMETTLGDSLYSSRKACSIVAGYGARPYFFPKVSVTFTSHGVPSWNNMLHEFASDPQGWLRIYHMRSISETVNSMDKRRFPWKLRKRLAWRKGVESFLRRDVHNIRQYSYLTYLQRDMVRTMQR